uniref:PDZ domain-containing protein n=1 Tax=Meloidogyne incognita TaxID=6306 RepID=A0A914NHW6_MELIC
MGCRLSTSPLISQSERFQAKSHSPRGRRRRRRESSSLQLLNTADQCFLSTGSSQEEIWIGQQQQHNSLYNSQRCLNPQLYFPSPSSLASTPKSPTHSPMQTATVSAWTPCSSRSLSPCASPAASLRGSWSYDIVFLPSHLERHIKILKSSLPLGVVLDADADKAINGCVAKNICSKKALAKDGRIQPGDFIVKINGENLRNVTNAQARAILKRANLIGAQCNISYITASDAGLWKDRFHRLDNVSMFPTDDSIQQIRSVQQNVFESSRLSPKL